MNKNKVKNLIKELPENCDFRVVIQCSDDQEMVKTLKKLRPNWATVLQRSAFGNCELVITDQR